MVNETMERMMAHTKPLQALVSPEVYARAQDLVREQLNAMVNAGNTSVIQIPGQQPSAPSASPASNTASLENNAPSNVASPQSVIGANKLSPLEEGAATKFSKNLLLPNFNSKEEFHSWLSKQPKMVQRAVYLKLSGNK